MGNSLTIKTDDKSLKCIFIQPDLNMHKWGWLEVLHEDEFLIKYQPKKKNVVADAVSRKSILSMITLLQMNITDVVHQDLVDDPLNNKILQL